MVGDGWGAEAAPGAALGGNQVVGGQENRCL